MTYSLTIGKLKRKKERYSLKTLIVYTTKYGSTAKCAYLLKEKLLGEVTIVDLNKQQAPKLQDFSTVVIGGSIYFGKIQKKIVTYCRENSTELLEKKIGLFICSGEKGNKQYQYLTGVFPQDIYNKAVIKSIFGDELYYEKLSLLEKIMMRLLKGVSQSYSNLSLTTIENFAHKLNEQS